MDFWLILFIFDGMLFIIIAGTVLYLGFFAVAALFHSKPDIPKAKKFNRFVILIPAYKQDNVIEQTVLAALSQAYPQRMFDVSSIPNNFTHTKFRGKYQSQIITICHFEPPGI